MSRDQWYPTKNDRVCSDHFTETDYRHPGDPNVLRPDLKLCAIPTVFPKHPAHKQKKIVKSRLSYTSTRMPAIAHSDLDAVSKPAENAEGVSDIEKPRLLSNASTSAAAIAHSDLDAVSNIAENAESASDIKKPRLLSNTSSLGAIAHSDLDAESNQAENDEGVSDMKKPRLLSYTSTSSAAFEHSDFDPTSTPAENAKGVSDIKKPKLLSSPFVNEHDYALTSEKLHKELKETKEKLKETLKELKSMKQKLKRRERIISKTLVLPYQLETPLNHAVFLEK